MLAKSTPRLSIDDRERFRSKVDVRGKDECWNWKRGKTRQGYGAFSVGRSMFRAHRISYFLAFGAIPDGLLVLHHCDNPACTNPSHLFVGTQADNMSDKTSKGRTPSGKDHHKTKLSGDTVQELSQEYRVSAQIIRLVLNRKYCTDV